MLNVNSSSVHSDGGDGMNGLLILTVSTTTYCTVSTTAFVIPINPGVSPTIPRNAQEIEINELNRHHQRQIYVWREFVATDKALKQLLLTAVDEIFIRALRHRITGYANVTTKKCYNTSSAHMEKSLQQH